MSCGMYINYAILVNSLKAGWQQHYKSTHSEEEQLPVFALEGINELCHNLACLANGDPLNKDTWVEIGDLTTAITQCIELHEANKEVTEVEQEDSIDD